MFLVNSFLGGKGGGGGGGAGRALGGLLSGGGGGGGGAGGIGNVIGGLLSGGGGGGGGGAGGAMGFLGGVISAIRSPGAGGPLPTAPIPPPNLSPQDMEVSASELMNILNKVVTRHPDLKTDGFGIDTCRSMVAVMDVSLGAIHTGKLGFEEFKYLWNNIKKWQAIYKQFDTDRSGTIGSNELPGAFEAAGFRLNPELYQMIIRRYSDEDGNMDFDNFISCLVRLDAMFRAFKSLDKDGSGQIRVNIQEWLQLTMYS
uniref:Calpain small subunit 1 n=1 Tax=Monodelphis domestica TaxID=13616 RepID=A0A5F8HJW3_MONDO